MDELANQKFKALSTVQNAVRLECQIACRPRGLLVAYVNGIEVGSKILDRRYAYGETIDIPICYFPHVVLPCDIRFAVEDLEIVSPLLVQSSEQVMEMIGPGDIRVDNFVIDSGLLRGTIVNISNGVHVPSAHIRINKRVIRTVVVEPIRARFEGGSTCSFAVPLRLGDLSLSGLEIELFVAGIEHPIGTLMYSNTPLTDANERVLSIEEAIRQLQKSTAVQLNTLSATMEKRLSLQQERLDSFIEYALCILLDVTPGKLTDSEATAMSSELRRFGQSVGASAATQDQVPDLPRSAILPLDSGGFAIGWYENEFNETGNFRWMTEAALLRNPYPLRGLHHLEIHVGQVYGAHEPMIDISLDEHDLDVVVERNGAFFLVKACARENAGSISGESLHLRSFASGCPAIDIGSNDQRILSLAVNKVEFFYQT